jgi:hypothetical protein
VTAAVPSVAKRRSPLGLWLRRVLLGLLVTVGLALLGWWWRMETLARQGREDLAAALAETHALDPRWRWEHIEEDRPALPDQRNSVAVILQVAQLCQKGEPADLFHGEPANRLRDEVFLARLQEFLLTQEQATAVAASLIDFPHGRATFPADGDSMTDPPPHVMACRPVTWLLQLDSDRLLHEGRVYAAAQHIHATLHTGASLRDEGQAISQLVRIAIRSIAANNVERLLGMGEPDEITLTLLQDHFTAEAAEFSVLTGLRGERALAHRAFAKWIDGKGTIADQFAKELGAPLFSATLMSHGIPGENAAYLRAMNRVVAIGQLPVEKQLAEWDSLEAEGRALRRAAMTEGHGVLAALTVPAMRGVGQAGVRDRTVMVCACGLLAVERFRRAQQRWPATLAELIPTYLPAVPIDPYSGGPLLYKVFDDGVAVYSAGKNGVDDGGVRINSRHFLEPDSDLGLRLWDPLHRRLPPLPPENAPKVEPVPLREMAP